MDTVRSEVPTATDESITRIGLLMEAAIAHQRMAEESVARLQSLTQSIDSVVRDEIRRTLIDEFVSLGEESRRAVQALQSVMRAGSLRSLLWSLGMTGASVALALSMAWYVLPSKPEIARLRAERDQIAATIANLERHGGRLDLGRCGGTARLCVRVDPRQPAFGVDHDYRIVGDR